MISVFLFWANFCILATKKEVEVLMIQRTFCCGRGRGGLFPSRHIRTEFF
jgi:hypothetical protein